MADDDIPNRDIFKTLLTLIILFLCGLNCYLFYNRYNVNKSSTGISEGESMYKDISRNNLLNQIQKIASRHEELQVAEEFIQERLQMTEQKYQEAVKKRRLFWPDHKHEDIYSALFYARFDCPFISERIGQIGDGGKWVCGLDHIINCATEESRACVVYSFGVSDDNASFEKEILARSKACVVRMYDPTITMNESAFEKLVNQFSPRATFATTGIGNRNTKTTQTLKSFMKKNGDIFIDILKVDIEEGNGFKILNDILEEFAEKDSSLLPFGQLQVKVHLHEYLEQLLGWMERLESAGLRTFSVAPNYIQICMANQQETSVKYFELAFINIRNYKNPILHS